MIGSLRHKMIRLEAVRMEDGGGGAEITWQGAGALWASVEYLTPLRDRSGERRRFLKRIAAETRADATLREGQRVRYENRDFEIVSIESIDERNRRQVFVGEEIPQIVALEEALS